MDPTIVAAIIGAAGALVAGVIAAIVAVLGFRKSSKDNRETLTQTLNAAREGQLTDRYTKAVEHLSSDKLDVRIGGIQALQLIARDSPQIYQPVVIEALATFVREHSHDQWRYRSMRTTLHPHGQGAPASRLPPISSATRTTYRTYSISPA